MKSSFKLLASLLFMTAATNSSALGLGTITAESALNEPLVAKIELLNAESLTNNDIIVAIGSQEDYRIAQVEREFSHTDFTFEARLDGEANPYISLTSSRAIVEPFVNFVVQVRWPQGKLLREYTILIDFPVFTGEQETSSMTTATTQPATRTTSTTTSSASDESTLDLRTSNNTQPRRTLTANTGEYYVQTGDTLWGVAGSVARSTGTTRNQAMLSIRDLNSEAFINGDINALKSGVLLRVPSQQQIVQRSATDAAREFAAIQQSGSRSIEATPVQARETNFRNQPGSSAPGGGRLALASVGALGSSIGANATGAEGTEVVGAFQDENLVLKEELDKVALENADLKDRLAALEERLELSEAVIEIQNNELALAQQVATEVNSSLEGESTEAVAPEVSAEDSIAETVDEVTPEPQIVQPAPIQEKSLVDTAIGFLPLIGALFIVLLLVAFLLLKRKKSKEDELLSQGSGEEYEVDHIDQDLSIESSIEDEMQATRSFTVDQDDDNIEAMDSLFSEDDDDASLFDDVEAKAQAESQQMEDTLANFEATNNFDATNVMDAQSESDFDADTSVEDFDDTGVVNNAYDESDDAIDELDEFADLDSFFNDDDIDDFDPDALEETDLDDSDELENTSSLDTGVSGSESAKNKVSGAFSDSSEKMEFESFEIPSDSSSESIAKASLDHGNSMDFEIGIDLPGIDESDGKEALEVDLNDAEGLSENAMDFDLDDIDPISEQDEITPIEVKDDANSMDFDLSGVDLGLGDDSDTSQDSADEDSDQSLDFENFGGTDSEQSLDDGYAVLEDEELDLDLAADALDLNDIDDDLETDMDDLLNDMQEQSEITSSSNVDSDSDESGSFSDFDLEGDDLLGDLSLASDGFDTDLSEEIATKLELADAYAEMGDARGAKELIEEILADGNESQQNAARLIAERIEGLV